MNTTTFQNPFAEYLPTSVEDAIQKSKDASVRAIEMNETFAGMLIEAFEDLTDKRFTTYTDIGKKSLKESSKVAKETITSVAKFASTVSANGNKK